MNNLILSDIASNLRAEDYALIVFTLAAAATDAWRKKIYNWATLPAFIAGVTLAAFSGGWKGLGFSLLGAFAGFIILYFFWAAGGMGAGDVKFLMAVGAIKGPIFVFKSALCGIFVAGIVTVIWMLARGVFFKSIKNVLIPFYTSFVSGFSVSPMPRTTSPALPFGFYLAIGVMGYWLYGAL
ncbi:A24 family peptidase [bacterium]|nr:prepilin peptidase [Candidatus Omnitrophota bacterium]MBU2528499.1 A24 family peptidase [bacterium]MBU3930793.1 A24 family peptidase [bacterium]MBU4122422.1 A24 family peptidase [bacterium]